MKNFMELNISRIFLWLTGARIPYKSDDYRDGDPLEYEIEIDHDSWADDEDSDSEEIWNLSCVGFAGVMDTILEIFDTYSYLFGTDRSFGLNPLPIASTRTLESI